MSAFPSQEDDDNSQPATSPPQQSSNRPSKRRRRSLEDSMPSEEEWFGGSEIASGPSSSPGESPPGQHEFDQEEDSAPMDRIWNMNAQSDTGDAAARADLNGLPPLAPWEGEYVCKDILLKMRDQTRKLQETSQWFHVPRNGRPNCGPASFRLLLHPAGNESAKTPGPAAYVELGPPELEADEAPASEWCYMDAQYYVSVLSFRDWKQSISQQDRFSFCSSNTDRGWHTIMDQHKEPIMNFVGPQGQMVFRFGVLPRGIRLCDRATRQRGLKNLGMTCYLNSLLQCLFHIPAFRAAIFQMTAHADEKLAEEIEALETSDKAFLVAEHASVLDSHQSYKLSDRSCPDAPPTRLLKDLTDAEIEDAYSENGLPKEYKIGNLTIDLSDSSTTSRALQKVFLQLNQPTVEHTDSRSGLRSSTEEDSVNCQDLIRSFNWDVQDQFMQHDAQELNRLLCDKLETEMKGGKSDGSIRTLFGGESEMFIECIDVDYKSKRKEVYYDLQLDVRGLPNIEASLQRYIEAEILEGDNAYFADHFGRQAARKGVRFLSCPPILQFHLKRFTYDLNLMDMVKINDEFRFPDTLDMEPFCPNAGQYNLLGVNVHQGDVHSGHYYAFIRVRGGDGKRAWLRFDDERVCRVDRYSAVDMNFGGPIEELHCPYAPRAAQHPARFVQNHSAYILFYIKAANQQELLTCPSPQRLNPGLEIRLKLQESVHARRNATRTLIEKNLQLALVLDRDIILGRAKGVWRHPSELPARQIQQKPIQMEAMEILQQTARDVESGALGEDVKTELFGEDKRRSIGLFYFDYSTRRNQMEELNLAQASGFSPRYCRDEELRSGLCLWSLELVNANANANANAAQTIGRNHAYIDGELKPPQRVQRLTLLLTSFGTHFEDQTALVDAHDKAKLCPLKIYDPWSSDLYYFGSVNFNQDKSDGRRLIGRKLTQTWRDRECREALMRQGLSSSMVDLLNHTLRGDSAFPSICAHWEGRGWFEAAPLRDLAAPPSAPYRPLCISFNLREFEGTEPLAAHCALEAGRTCTSAELLQTLSDLRKCESESEALQYVFYGESTPRDVNPVKIETLRQQLERATHRFAESPATLLCTLRGTRRIRFELYDFMALIGRCESITGRRCFLQSTDSASDGLSSETIRSAFGAPLAEATETVVVLLTWPAECLLKIAGVLLGAKAEYLMMMDSPPTLFGVSSPDPVRRGNAFELLADEPRAREPLTLQNLGPKLVSDVVSPYIHRQDAYGYVRPSEKFFANESDLVNCPTIPVMLMPRATSTIWNKSHETATCFVKVFQNAILGALVVDLKRLNVMIIKEVIAYCLGLISHDDRMVALLSSPLSAWQTKSVDLLAYTPHSISRLSHSDSVESHLGVLMGLRSPQIRIELVPVLGDVESGEQILMDCFNIDSSNSFFGHPFSVPLRRVDTLADILPRMPVEAQSAAFYLCPTRSILDHLRLRKAVQLQSLLWPASIGMTKTGDGKIAISPQCLIVEHTNHSGGTGRSGGRSRRQTALNLR